MDGFSIPPSLVWAILGLIFIGAEVFIGSMRYSFPCRIDAAKEEMR